MGSLHEDMKAGNANVHHSAEAASTTIYGSYEKLSGKPEKRQAQLVWVSLLLGIGCGLGIGWMFGPMWGNSGIVSSDGNQFFDYFTTVDTDLWKSPRDFQKTCIPKFAPGANGTTDMCAAFCLTPEGSHLTLNEFGMRLRMDNTLNSCSYSYNTAYATAEIQSYREFLYGDFSTYLRAGHRNEGAGAPNSETCFALFASNKGSDKKQEINFCILSRWTYSNFTITYYGDKGGGGMFHFPHENFQKDFHLFQIKWRNSSIHWMLDNKSVYFQTGTPGVNIPNRPMRISLLLRPDSYSDYSKYVGSSETTVRFVQYNGDI